ncbi:hypothetical protein HZS_4174, partial [Henneguya salminicola]
MIADNTKLDDEKTNAVQSRSTTSNNFIKMRNKILGSLIYNFIKNIHNKNLLTVNGSIKIGLNETIEKRAHDITNSCIDSIENFDDSFVDNYRLILIEYLKGLNSTIDVFPNDDSTESMQKLTYNNSYLASQSEILKEIEMTQSSFIPFKDTLDFNANPQNSLNFTPEFCNNIKNIFYNFSPEQIKWKILALDQYVIECPTIGHRPLVDSSYLSQFFDPNIPWSHGYVDGKNSRKNKSETHRVKQSSAEKIKKINDPSKTPTKPTPREPSPQKEPDKIIKAKRKYRTALNIHQKSSDCLSLPITPCAPTHIEQIKYSEIITPSWKEFSQIPKIINESQIEEDLSDEVFVQRHSTFETDEHNKYMMAIQMGRPQKKRNPNNSKQSDKISQKYDSKFREDPNLINNFAIYNEDS